LSLMIVNSIVCVNVEVKRTGWHILFLLFILVIQL